MELWVWVKNNIPAQAHATFATYDDLRTHHLITVSLEVVQTSGFRGKSALSTGTAVTLLANHANV